MGFHIIRFAAPKSNTNIKISNSCAGSEAVAPPALTW